MLNEIKFQKYWWNDIGDADKKMMTVPIILYNEKFNNYGEIIVKWFW